MFWVYKINTLYATTQIIEIKNKCVDKKSNIEHVTKIDIWDKINDE